MKKGAAPLFAAAGLLSIVGGGFSLVLVKTHAALAVGEEPSWCDFGKALHCAPVLLSPWSEMGGIPLAVLSLAFYALLLLICVQALLRLEPEPLVAQRNAGIILLASLFSVVLSARLAYISKVYIGAFCPFCAALYIVSGLFLPIALLLAARAGAPWRDVARQEAREFRKRPFQTAGILLLLGACPFLLPSIERLYQDRILALRPDYRAVLDDEVPRYYALEAAVAGSPWQGDAAAKVWIVLFVDYNCPYCRMLSIEVDSLADRHPFRWKVFHYPHEKSCNPFSQSNKPGSCLAALRGVIAGRENRFEAYRRWAFLHSYEAGGDSAGGIARATGIPEAKLRDWKQDSGAIEALREEVLWARRAGVEVTPTIFIDGTGVPGLPPVWFLERWIRAEIARGGTGETTAVSPQPRGE